MPKPPSGKSPTGRPPLGLYPKVSRVSLSKHLQTSPNNISRILLGYRKPSASQFIILAQILCVSPQRLDRELRTAQDRMLRKQSRRIKQGSIPDVSPKELKPNK